MGVYGTRINIDSPFFVATDDDDTIERQRAEMVLSTKKGTYWTAPDLGITLEDFVNAEISAESFARLAGLVKSALAADSIFREAAIAVAVTKATQTAQGLDVSFAVSIALPDQDAILLSVRVSSGGVTVGA